MTQAGSYVPDMLGLPAPTHTYCTYNWNEGGKKKAPARQWDLTAEGSEAWWSRKEERRGRSAIHKEEGNCEEERGSAVTSWEECLGSLPVPALIEEKHLGSLGVSPSSCFCWLRVCAFFSVCVCAHPSRPRLQWIMCVCIPVCADRALTHTHTVCKHTGFNEMLLSQKYSKQPPQAASRLCERHHGNEKSGWFLFVSWTL